MISVAIMAHPKREQWIPGLVDAIDHDDIRVVWDGRNDRWDTGRRALQAYDPKASHHLVVQDDAIVCRDLVAGLSEAARYSQCRPVGLYLGTVRPSKGVVERAAWDSRRRGLSWVEMKGPWWGVGILIPTADIDEIVEFGDRRRNVENYDRKISRFYEGEGVKCWYTFPSLVEHRHGTDGGRPLNPSLIPGRNGTNRRAHEFIGETASALDVDWSRTKAVTHA